MIIEKICILYIMSKVTKIGKKKQTGLYFKNIITRKVNVQFKDVGGNIEHIISQDLRQKLEGKCINEGYIKRDSVNILTYSSGLIDGNSVIFDVVFECQACRPVEGMKIRCTIKNVTKAGIRAEISGDISPVVIFIARDHQYQSKYFSTRKEGEDILIKVIGQRFELNDKYISIIATLVEPKKKIK